MNSFLVKKEERDILNFTLILIIEFYINLLDTNNNNFIQKFFMSEIFLNLICFEQEEIFRPFFYNLFYVIFQNISKPTPKLDLLEIFFSEKIIINFFNLNIINCDVDLVFRLNLIMIFDLIVKEIKKICNNENSEELTCLYPNFFNYLNELSERKISK